MTAEIQYTHDVFISYSSVNHKWVRGELLSRLESAGLKVIIDCRDFEGGVPTRANIEEAIRNSRHTLLVITPDWQKSGWTELEMDLLAQKDPANRQRTTLPLLLERCERLPSYLTRLVYFDFTQDSEREAQMNRLVGAILSPSKLAPERVPDREQTAAKIETQQVNRVASALEAKNPLDDSNISSSERERSSSADALALLHEFLQDPVIQRAAAGFQAVFKGASEQIKVLSDYKDLHDILHELQFKWYDPILIPAERFRNGEGGSDDLVLYDLDLEGNVSELQKVARRRSLPRRQKSCLDKIIEAQQTLHEALEHSQPGQLGEALEQMGSVLDVFPSLINSAMLAAAEALRLPDLADALMALRDRLETIQITPEKMRQFEEGVSELRRLEQDLTALVHEHDTWQQVDVDLRQIDDDVLEDLTRFKLAWADLKKNVESLYNGKIVDWARPFVVESQKLDNSLMAGDLDKIRDSFRAYRNRAGTRFYKVDKQLKDKCAEVRQVGMALDSVLRMLA